MPRRRPELGVGLGPATFPYDQVGGPMAREQDQVGFGGDPAQQALAYLTNNQPEQAVPSPQEQASQPAPVNQGPPTGAPPQPGMPAEGQQPMSSDFSDEELATLMSQQSPEDPQVAQVIAALQDPNTPPENRQMINTMLALAARRRMAGLNS